MQNRKFFECECRERESSRILLLVLSNRSVPKFSNLFKWYFPFPHIILCFVAINFYLCHWITPPFPASAFSSETFDDAKAFLSINAILFQRQQHVWIDLSFRSMSEPNVIPLTLRFANVWRRKKQWINKSEDNKSILGSNVSPVGRLFFHFVADFLRFACKLFHRRYVILLESSFIVKGSERIVHQKLKFYRKCLRSDGIYICLATSSSAGTPEGGWHSHLGTLLTTHDFHIQRWLSRIIRIVSLWIKHFSSLPSFLTQAKPKENMKKNLIKFLFPPSRVALHNCASRFEYGSSSRSANFCCGSAAQSTVSSSQNASRTLDPRVNFSLPLSRKLRQSR